MVDFELLYPLARDVGHRGNKKHQARIQGNERVVNRIFLKKKLPRNHSEKAFSFYEDFI